MEKELVTTEETILAFEATMKNKYIRRKHKWEMTDKESHRALRFKRFKRQTLHELISVCPEYEGVRPFYIENIMKSVNASGSSVYRASTS